MSEVYDRYVDTAGNYHYTDTETGHHVIPNTAVGNFPPPRLIKTNADRIRSMTDEEIADFLCDIGECDRRCPAKIGDCIFSDSTCRQAWLEWLKEEVGE